MRVSLIAAVAENGVIGRDNMLPWRLPTDLKHFRRLTIGHPVIMGRRNYESIGRPLADRTNIVMSRRADFQAPGCIVVPSLEGAFAASCPTEEVFIAGGAEIYRQTINCADRLHLTLVHAAVVGDTFFPAFDWAAWRETARTRHAADERHAYAYSFVELERAV